MGWLLFHADDGAADECGGHWAGCLKTSRSSVVEGRVWARWRIVLPVTRTSHGGSLGGRRVENFRVLQL